MTDRRRFAALALALLSQLTGGMVVICDEGTGGHTLELFSRTCCDTDGEAASAPADRDGDEVPCGSCSDVPLALFHQAHEDLQDWSHQELTTLAVLPEMPRPPLSRGGAFARAPTPPGVIPTGTRLTGTVLQLR